VGVIRLSKNLNPQQGIIEYLSQNQISEDRLISYTAASRGVNISDVYFIYISKLEPQIVSGFPLNNSLLPDIAAPSKVTLVFSTKLDQAKLSSTAGLFTVEEGFTTSTEITPSDITLLEDLKTIEINVSAYFINQKVYSIIARPGILSLEGLAKEKPEQWTIHIAPYEAVFTGQVTGQGSGAPVDAVYVLSEPNAALPNALIISALNGLYIQTGGGGIVVSGSGITQHYADINNPHAVSATQVGAYTTSQVNTILVYTTGQLTGQLSGVSLNLSSHTADVGNPHAVTATQVGSLTIAQSASSLAYTTGHLTGQLTGVVTGYAQHKNEATIHFTQAQISIPSTQITDFSAAVSFIATGIVSGSSGHYQPRDASLTAYANLTTAADTYVYYTASDVPVTSTITTFGRSLVDDANAAAASSTLGLNQIPYLNGSPGDIVYKDPNGNWVTLPLGDEGDVLTVAIVSEQLTIAWLPPSP